MPCPNGKAWCPGPGGFGNKCQPCQQTPASGGLHPPLATGGKTVPLPPPPSPRGVTPPPIVKGVPPPLSMPALKVKTVIPLPDPVLPLPNAAPGVGRSVVLYRGDSREPGEIKRVGFERWGESIANVSKIGGIGNYIGEKCKELKNGATFADFVRVSKNQARPTISTSLNKGCGGYDSGPIYKIEVSGLQEFELNEKIMPPAFAGISWRSDGLKAYIDGPNLAQSRTIIIDLRLATEEWAFFTNVHPSRITEYKLVKGDFKSMSTVEVKVKKLW